MHNLIKIKLFRFLLFCTYPIAILFIYPFILLQRKKKAKLFFFFDRYCIGGAQRVHLDILKSVNEIQKIVFFTRNSLNKSLKKDFYSFPNTTCVDIHFWCDNLILRLFSVHYFSFISNRNATFLLSSNSTFFYDILPFINKNIFKAELLHNFTYGKKGMEFFGLYNYKYLDKRLTIDLITSENIIAQYKQNNIPDLYNQKIELIEFGVIIPEAINKNYSSPLKILYAGRGGFQKRIWLINFIAEHFIKNKYDVEFHFAGTMINELSTLVKERSFIYGELSNKDDLNKLYTLCHAIILTSSFEGFPMVIKETMAYGCVPIVTALPGNKIHLTNFNNALLINDIENEKNLTEEAILNIELLANSNSTLKQLSENAYEYAKSNFKKDHFLKKYRALLLQKK